MNIRAVHTDIVTPNTFSVIELVDKYVTAMGEGDVLIMSAKIVSLCEGGWRKSEDTDALAREQAELYIEPIESKYSQMLTVARGTLLVAAGVDESNVKTGVITLPARPYATAARVRSHLRKRFHREQLGVLIVDSASRPLRAGTVGTCLGSAGIREVQDYRGALDLFGRQMQYSRANHAEALAAVAVAMMGEGDEQSPMCIASNVSFVQFKSDVYEPEYDPWALIEDDIFAPFLARGNWRQGGTRNRRD